MKKTVLIIENDEKYLATVSEILEENDYRVLKASSIKEAERLLEKDYFHLILSDIRMKDDDNPDDYSGIKLMSEKKYKHTLKIFMTSYEEYENSVRTLGMGADAKQLAIYLFSKDNKPKLFLKKIKLAFEHYVRINLDLSIDFPISHSFYDLADHIYNTELTQAECKNKADEIQGLFRQAFNEYLKATLMIEDIILTRDAQVLLLVRIKQENGMQQPVSLIRCGRQDAIEREYDAYSDINKGRLVKTWALRVDAVKFAINFGIILYSVSGTDIDKLLLLPDYFKLQTASAFKNVLKTIYNKAESTLYYQSCAPEKVKTLCQLHKEFAGFKDNCTDRQAFKANFENTLDYLMNRYSVYVEGEPDKQTLQLSLPDGTRLSCRNPLHIFSENGKPSSKSVLLRFSMGNLNNHDILIDSDKKPWLASFSKICPAPPLADCISLESKIRFEWCNFLKSGFDQFLIFERLLTDIHPAFGFGAKANIETNKNPDLMNITDDLMKKALNSIDTLRKIATDSDVTAPSEYFSGVFFQGANIMINNPSPDRKAHALLAMAMIYENRGTDSPLT